MDGTTGRVVHGVEQLNEMVFAPTGYFTIEDTDEWLATTTQENCEMRHYYRIETSAFAPTEMSVPAVTCESENAALDKMTEIGNKWRDKLNAPLMREIGGR